MTNSVLIFQCWKMFNATVDVTFLNIVTSLSMTSTHPTVAVNARMLRPRKSALERALLGQRKLVTALKATEKSFVTRKMTSDMQ